MSALRAAARTKPVVRAQGGPLARGRPGARDPRRTRCSTPRCGAPARCACEPTRSCSRRRACWRRARIPRGDRIADRRQRPRTRAARGGQRARAGVPLAEFEPATVARAGHGAARGERARQSGRRARRCAARTVRRRGRRRARAIPSVDAVIALHVPRPAIGADRCGARGRGGRARLAQAGARRVAGRDRPPRGARCAGGRRHRELLHARERGRGVRVPRVLPAAPGTGCSRCRRRSRSRNRPTSRSSARLRDAVDGRRTLPASELSQLLAAFGLPRAEDRAVPTRSPKRRRSRAASAIRCRSRSMPPCRCRSPRAARFPTAARWRRPTALLLDDARTLLHGPGWGGHVFVRKIAAHRARAASSRSASRRIRCSGR